MKNFKMKEIITLIFSNFLFSIIVFSLWLLNSQSTIAQIEPSIDAELKCSGGVATAPPCINDPNLVVNTVISGLTTPVTMVFLGPNDFLVSEQITGKVKRVTHGVVTNTVLDLAVNFAQERGLLGMTLHPNFPTTPYVYLFYTESTLVNPTTGLLSDTNVPSNTS